MTPHIEAKKEDIANIVLMPGDPNRAKYITETYLEDYKLVNSLRGELAYTGYYKGKRVTVFSSGMGIASMGIYSHELFDVYDVDYIIRIGTAGSYKEDLKVYDVLVADSAFSNTSFDEESTGEDMKVINSSFDLNSKIMMIAHKKRMDVKLGRVHTTEAFYNDSNLADLNGSLAVEMETYALLFNAKKFHKKATSILTISDNLVTKEEISALEREKKLNDMIFLALETALIL
ncbi:MAG: purine-nucleoside phosphorylase [Bacilli bacterium]|nr:purine-nucleoside phosphorylase [Bacilli bacterium]